MAFDDQVAVEPKHLIHQTAVLVAVGDDNGIDAPVDTLDGEPKIRNLRQRHGPVVAQGRFAVNDAVRFRQQPGGYR